MRPGSRWYVPSRVCGRESRKKGLGPVSRNSLKLFGPAKPFVKLRSAHSKKLVFYYVSEIGKGEFVARFYALKRLRF